jgi:hypothetical protein
MLNIQPNVLIHYFFVAAMKIFNFPVLHFHIWIEFSYSSVAQAMKINQSMIRIVLSQKTACFLVVIDTLISNKYINKLVSDGDPNNNFTRT